MQASVFYEKSDVCQLQEPQEEKQAGGRAARLCYNATKTEPQREMFGRQCASRHSLKEHEVQPFVLPPLKDG